MSYISEIHSDRIGSLFEDGDGNYSVGECLSPSLLWQYRDELEGIDRGPFYQERKHLQKLRRQRASANKLNSWFQKPSIMVLIPTLGRS